MKRSAAVSACTQHRDARLLGSHRETCQAATAKDRRLEHHAERHLNLSRTAYGLHGLPETGGTVIEAILRARSGAA